MKTIRLLLLAATACLFSPASFPAQRSIPTSVEIAAKYDAMAKALEEQYAKLVREARQRIDRFNDLIKQYDKNIKDLKAEAQKLQTPRKMAKSGQGSVGTAKEEEIRDRLKAIDREVSNIMREVAKTKDEIKSIEAQIERLQRDKEKQLAEIQQQKEKALSAIAKTAEEKPRR